MVMFAGLIFEDKLMAWLIIASFILVICEGNLSVGNLKPIKKGIEPLLAFLINPTEHVDDPTLGQQWQSLIK